MSLPNYEELAIQGREFRETVFTDEFLAVAGVHLRAVQDSVVGQYIHTNLAHVTHASNADRILAEGLRPGAGLIDEEDEAFFVRQYDAQQRRRPDPGDGNLVSKFILGLERDGSPRGLTATNQPDKVHIETYAVPERLVFFMRNLWRLGTHPEVAVHDQRRAEDIVEKYASRLVVAGQVEAAVFRLDPRSPVVARATISQPNFAEADEELAVNVMQQVQRDMMVTLEGPVAPEHVSLESRHSFPGEKIMTNILDRDSQIVFK